MNSRWLYLLAAHRKRMFRKLMAVLLNYVRCYTSAVGKVPMRVGKGLSVVVFVLIGVFMVFAQTDPELIERARGAIDKRDYVSAMADLNAVLKRQPSNEAALTLRARAYTRQSKYAEGWADAAKVLAKNPKNYDALNIRGVIKRQRDKDLNGALADFTQAVAIQPDFYLGYVNIGFTNRALGKVPQAFSAFDRAIALEPNNPVAYENRASLFGWILRWEDAVNDMTKAISIDAAGSGYLGLRGYYHLRMYLNDTSYKLSRAENDITRALLLNQNDMFAISVRSILRVEGNDADAAMADAEKALQADPRAFMALIARGFVKNFRKDSVGALDDIESAYQLAPNDPWLNELRDRFSKGVDSPKAKTIRQEINAKLLATVEKAKQRVAANPWDFKSYDSLRDTFVKANVEWTEVRGYWENMVTTNPKNLCARRFLGEYRARDYRDMIDYFDSALNLYDGKNGTECAAQIAFRIGREYSSRNRTQEASSYFARAKQLVPDLQYLDGNIAFNESKIAEAKAADEALQRAFDEAAREKTALVTPQNSIKTKSKKVDIVKTKAAIAAYDIVHSSVESDVRALQQAADKYASAGMYRQFYRGTYNRINATLGRMINSIQEFMSKHGDYLPQELYDHLMQDRQKILDIEVPPPY